MASCSKAEAWSSERSAVAIKEPNTPVKQVALACARGGQRQPPPRLPPGPGGRVGVDKAVYRAEWETQQGPR